MIKNKDVVEAGYFAQKRGGITCLACQEKCSGFDSRPAVPHFSLRLLLLTFLSFKECRSVEILRGSRKARGSNPQMFQTSVASLIIYQVP